MQRETLIKGLRRAALIKAPAWYLKKDCLSIVMSLCCYSTICNRGVRGKRPVNGENFGLVHSPPIYLLVKVF
jgi:hypothetical protein